MTRRTTDSTVKRTQQDRRHTYGAEARDGAGRENNVRRLHHAHRQPAPVHVTRRGQQLDQQPPDQRLACTDRIDGKIVVLKIETERRR